MPRIFAIYDPDFPGNFDFHSNFQFNNIEKKWEFMGYKCVYCEKLLKINPENTKHLKSCKGISRKKPKDEEDEPLVVNTQGKEWQPFETNHVFSRQKKNFFD